MGTPTDPDVPPHQVTGIGDGDALHSVRPGAGVARLIGLGAGALAVLAAVGFGTAALLRAPVTTGSTPTSARHITVSVPVIPMTPGQIVDLLGQPPDYGGLRDPVRRGACLAGLGYPASTQILGARPVQVDGMSGVVLVVAGDAENTVTAIAVASTCNAADTGLLASTSVQRP